MLSKLRKQEKYCGDRNISPRTVEENQTKLESSGRPGDRSRSKSVKDIRERRLLEFGGFGIE